MQPDKPISATPTPDISTPSSPVAPTTRPRLNLAKRTVSAAPPQAESGSATETSSKASPFGAAKPIDTTKRDQEIEERRVAARKQKEEDDAKAKAEREKVAAEKAAKGEVAGSASRAAVEGGATGAVAGSQTNGRSTSISTRGMGQGRGEEKEVKENGRTDYRILQREENGGDNAADAETEAEGGMPMEHANGEIIDSNDKDTKPQEIVRDAANPEPETTAEAAQNDGWNTVPSKTPKPRGKPRGGSTRGGRGGREERDGARALAS